MSSTSERNFDAPNGDELVAYLDGELPSDDCRRIEERLANDPEYRQQLRDLDQAWEALAVLPATKADDHFARTTIEMVSVAAEKEAKQQATATAAAGRRRILQWACAGAIVTALGFAATRVTLPDSNAKLLDDLPVILQLDVLSQIDTVKFIEQLAQQKYVSQLTSDLAASDLAALRSDVADVRAANAESLDERRQWLAERSPAQKAALAAQAERFKELDRNPARQQRLRDLNRQFQSADNSEQLQTTLLAYGQWLALRSNGDQEDLRLLPADQRLEEIQRYIDADNRRALQRLSEAERDNLRKTILAIAEERKSEFVESPWWLGRDAKRGPREPLPQFIVVWAMVNDPDRVTVKRLIEQLSAERRQYFETLPDRRRDRRDRMQQLFFWINDAMNQRTDAAALSKYFASEKLDSSQREWLLSLPSDEMQNQLERLYLTTEFGIRGFDEWLGEFGPPGVFGPGPPPGSGGPGGPRPEDGGPPPGRRGPGGPPRDGFGPDMRLEFGPDGRSPGFRLRGRRNGRPDLPPGQAPGDEASPPAEAEPAGPQNDPAGDGSN